MINMFLEADDEKEDEELEKYDSEEEDKELDDTKSSGTSNDYLDTSSDDMDSDDSFDFDDYYSSSDTGNFDCIAKIAYAINIAKNNLSHIHTHCSGKKFINIHYNITQDKDLEYEWQDLFSELALEDEGTKLDNMCNATRYCTDLTVEDADDYNYTQACTAVRDNFKYIKQCMEDARNNSAIYDRTDIQSILDDKIGILNKKINFLFNRMLKNSSTDSLEESSINLYI